MIIIMYIIMKLGKWLEGKELDWSGLSSKEFKELFCGGLVD